MLASSFRTFFCAPFPAVHVDGSSRLVVLEVEAEVDALGAGRRRGGLGRLALKGLGAASRRVDFGAMSGRGIRDLAVR